MRWNISNNLNWSRLGIGQVLVGLVFASLYFSPALSNLFEVTVVLLVATSEFLRARVRDFFLTPLAKWYSMFLLVLVLAALNGLLRGNSDIGEIWGWRKVLLLPLGAALFLGEECAKKRLSLAFVGISIIFAAWASVNLFIGLSPVVAKNAVIQGMFFTAAVIFSINLFFEANSFRAKFFLILACILLSSSVFFLTNGRSGYLAWLIGVPLAIFLVPQIKRRTRLSIAACLMVAGFGSVFLSGVAKESFLQGFSEMQGAKTQSHETRMGDRVIMWQRTLEMAPNHLLFGAGLAGFSRVYDDYWRPENAVGWKGLSDPHNQYFKFAIELSGLGLIAFLLFLFKIVSPLLRYGSQRCLVSILFAWCATSFFSAHFTTFHEGHFIWLFIGVFLSFRAQNR
jgi:O-antigen ligase